MAVDVTALERKWLSDHTTGVGPQTPLNDLKRKYYVSQIGGPAADVRYLQDLEKQWLRKVITDASGTPSGTRHVEQLWREAVTALGYRVSNYVNENKATFYINTA